MLVPSRRRMWRLSDRTSWAGGQDLRADRRPPVKLRAVTGLALAAIGAAGLFASIFRLSLPISGPPSAAVPPTVRITTVAPLPADVARFTGVVRARTESNLGFRVAARSWNGWSIPVSECGPASRSCVSTPSISCWR